MLLRLLIASLCVLALSAAPQQLKEIAMPTVSPAEAVQQAIKEDPDVAQAVQANSSQLYLLKTVSLATGTVADLDLPPEKYLPGGAPDRVRENGMTIFSSLDNATAAVPEKSTEPSDFLVKLVPVSIN